ncbi:MAG: ribbon-helix-helix protein, CopG family [Proteobacteria bacterium]|jgi:predicted transcriptional regulator|nr:ribbon-helix-helix protein, CopG family [Pseudomonadota bacterium]
MKPRHNLYLDEDVGEQLEALTAKAGSSKSSIVNDAVRAYLARRGAKELDDAFKVRLDRVSEQLRRLERDQSVMIESFALFVRYHLGITPPLPASEQAAAQALGRDRFQQFIEQVGRRMAGDKRIAEEVAERAIAARSASEPTLHQMAAE